MTVDASASEASVTLKGGDGKAILTGGEANDIIIMGKGGGTANGGEGHDTITLGAGADTVVLGAGTAFSDLNANADNVISFASDDKIDFDGLLSGFGSGDFSGVATNATIAATDDGKLLVVSASFNGANDAANLVSLFSASVATDLDAVLVTTDGTDTYVWYVDANADSTAGVSAGDITLVGTLDDLGTVLVQGNFA